MKHPRAAGTAGEADDQVLAQLLERLADDARQGKPVDIAAVTRDHPELQSELRDLWGTAQLASAVVPRLGSSPERRSDAPDWPDESPLTLPFQLGDYLLLDQVGRGGMGVVYRARQASLGREVAVKMLPGGKWASAVDLQRFRSEAAAAARLDHPHIVPVYEVGEYQGHIYFSMRFVAGQTLSERLAQGPMDPRQAARLVARAARAIEAAHQQGILHRDLKPSNILIDLDGEPHVTDFGLAKQLGDSVHLTGSGAVRGTPAYMAPEQAAGDRGRWSPASDVYSLGTILFHALTGRPPFQASRPVDVILKVLDEEPPRVRELNPRVDRDLEMITLKCLQKPPDLRYASAAALADDLEAYLKDEPVSVRSLHLRQVVSRLLRETHHAPVLENWGLLWMWHSLVLLVVCLLTNGLYWGGDRNRIHYFLLWTAGLGAWAAVFWALRRRMGPVTFVERQIVHVWAASLISIALLFPIEHILGLDVLRLTPVVALTSGMVFLLKAAVLSGAFYVQAVALFLSALAIARWPAYGHVIFGVVAAGSFFVPGWKYYRQRKFATR
jgi:serine/threonine-protein kinase